MEQVDQAYLDELLASAGENSKTDNLQTKDSEPDLTYDGIKDMAQSLGRGNRDLDMKVVMIFLKVSYRLQLLAYNNLYLVFVEDVE